MPESHGGCGEQLTANAELLSPILRARADQVQFDAVLRTRRDDAEPEEDALPVFKTTSYSTHEPHLIVAMGNELRPFAYAPEFHIDMARPFTMAHRRHSSVVAWLHRRRNHGYAALSGRVWLVELTRRE